jgi:hypothetical protein
MHATVVVIAEHGRLQADGWVDCGLNASVVTGLLIAYRKELYYRRIFWLKEALGLKDQTYNNLHFLGKRTVKINLRGNNG